MAKRKLIIIGAAGRDFHNFNTRYREDESVEVVAFTAEQIPGIDDRTYPAELAGPLYPNGIPIRPEEELPQLIKDLGADECAFSYSDVRYEHVMGVAAIVQAAGASFNLLGPDDTEVKSSKPVHPPPHALRRPRRTEGPALRRAIRPREAPVHGRGN
jgi:predicted GTPase